jgi:hypothetical protein
MNTKMLFVLIIAGMLSAMQVNAFCGFYVAKADAKLFNNKSEVILVRDGDRTVITMSNDFKGTVRDFAMVVPVPVVLREDQIRVVNRQIFDNLDAYSGPRLVEYYDTNPCMPEVEFARAMNSMAESATSRMMIVEDSAEEMELGVTIEAEYTVGEYDILLLSAKESKGLKTWLLQNDYKIPAQAEEVLEPYIKSDMKFFVVKVNLDEYLNSNAEYLNPIQIEFSHDRFMLPIRLGMANADGEQDLIIYAFTKQGRVECTNYRTVKIPTDRNIPLFVQPKFGEFYKALFDKAYKENARRAVFLEYAWDVSMQNNVKCDPCVGPPPMSYEFQQAGVNWGTQWGGESIFFTRLHVRYTRDRFPQDLSFQVTPNKERFQGRYILTHPASGEFSCQEGQDYLVKLQNRRMKEVDELSTLTNWEGRHAYNYIHEYSNRIKEDRNSAPVVLPFSSGGKGPLSLILILGLLAMAWWSVRWFIKLKTA